MNLHEVKIGEKLMCDVYGEVRSTGFDVWGNSYVQLEMNTKDGKYYGTAQVPPEWCWRLEGAEKVSPNQHVTNGKD